MKILLRDIPQGHSVIEQEAPPSSFDMTNWLHPVSLIGVCLDADRRDQQITLQGEVGLAARDTCGRCLTNFQFEVRATILIVADRRGSDEPDEEDALELEGSILYHEGIELDLGPAIREAIILEAPQVVLCKSDCRGLCPECGQNRNEVSCGCTPPKGDLRWEALKDLKDLKNERPEAKR